MQCKTLISQMLNPNPALRCTMEDIKNSSWMTKGYDGPPDNYVPVRQHLELPLNLEVIKRMKGFGFGTDEEIKCKLEDIIQKRNLLKQQQSTFHNEKESKNNFFRKENFSAQKFDLKGVGRALNKSKSEKWKPGLPEYSIVSIYYLVQEKMEKDISSGRISVVEKKENQVVEDNNGATRQNNEDIMTDLEGRSSVESKLIQNEEVENAIPLSSDNEESINALSAPTSPRLSRKDIIFIDEQPVKKRRSRPRAASMGELAIPNSMKSFKEIKDFVGRKKKKRLSKKVITEAESESDLGDSERVEKDLENTSPLEANLSESENDIFGSSSNTEGLGAGLGEKKKIASHLVSAVKKKMSQFGNRNQRNSSSNKEDLLDRETVSENEVESLSPSTVPFQKSNTIGTGPRNSRLSRNRNEFGNNPKRHQNHFNKEVSGTLVEDISSVKEEKLHRMKKRRSLGNQFQSSKSFFQGDDIKFNKNDIHDLEIEIVTPASSPANPTLPTSVIHIAGDVTDKSHYKKKERVDSNVKKVFMKGLFSVLTSSTKPTSFIRKDLIRVFQFLNVEFHESGLQLLFNYFYFLLDGVFECRYIIDLKKNLPNSPAEEKSNVASKEDKEKAEKKLEITDDLDLFHVGSEEECDQATSSCVNNGNSNIKRVSAAQQQVPSSPQDKPPKLPKFPSASNLKQKIQQQKLEHQNDVILTSAEAEILKVNENIENLQPDKLKSIETENASINNNRNFLIPMNIKTFNSTTVFFEVFIVKIGWIGLHGVRFRRIEGNIWQVKRNYLFEIY
ncbi:serine/threonine-protein kinase KIN2 [Clydaea vesicula]|uniref:non-specific serine/threonine protein kinase n=1 Tax=Clydaea vesicula TaxID=447962 RepID=A0AAD5U4E3_9FUNG|nr:serine/threonine-protein kinase KIN2 [Clydaea vesicula]